MPIEVNYPVAARQHECYGCGSIIHAGVGYLDFQYHERRRFQHWRYCGACEGIVSHYLLGNRNHAQELAQMSTPFRTGEDIEILPRVWDWLVTLHGVDEVLRSIYKPFMKLEPTRTSDIANFYGEVTITFNFPFFGEWCEVVGNNSVMTPDINGMYVVGDLYEQCKERAQSAVLQKAVGLLEEYSRTQRVRHHHRIYKLHKAAKRLHAEVFPQVNNARAELAAGLRHWTRDVWVKDKKAPAKDAEFTWMKTLPKEIEHDVFKARLIDNAHDLYNEGEVMEHCIYNSFYSEIRQGDYVAYHIDSPLTNSGFTVGFMRGKEGWTFDQCKARKNSTNHNKNPLLNQAISKIHQQLNKGE